MTDDHSRRLGRRAFAKAGLGGAAALGLGAGAAQAEPKRVPLDITSPDATLDAFIKLIGDTSGKPVIGMYSGHVFGNVEGERLKPLFGFEGFGIGRFERQSDGSFRQLWREVGVYRDIDTGEIMRMWKNPYSGETVEILDVQNDPVNAVWKTTTPEIPPMPGLDFLFGNYGQGNRMVLPWLIDRQGDWASLMYDVHGIRPNSLDPNVWKRESSGPRFRVTECFQYGGKLSEIENPEITSVIFTGGWQRVADWLPWMLMDQRPGHLFYRAVTRKLTMVEQLPADLLAYARQNYPVFLTPPTDWTLKTVSSFDVYKQKRKPAPPRAP